MIRERNIVLSIILSIVTCGIYGIVWFIQLTDEVVYASEGKEYSTSGGIAFLLSIVTCGIYSFYWAYKMGQSVGAIKSKHFGTTGDDGLIYLLVSLFGFSIIAYCLAQSELNKVARITNAQAINV